MIYVVLFASWLVCKEALLGDSLPEMPHHVRWQTVHDPNKHFREGLNDVWVVKSLHHHLQHHRHADEKLSERAYKLAQKLAQKLTKHVCDEACL